MENIGAGRWQAFAELAKELEEINSKEAIAFMDVYTLSPLSDEIIIALNIPNTCKLNKAVPQEEVMATQQSADILIHVEPLNKRDASFLSFVFLYKVGGLFV